MAHPLMENALSPDERIAALRERVVARKRHGETSFVRPDPVAGAASLRASEKVGSWQVRRGLLARDRLAAVEFEFDAMDLLAGRIRPGDGEHARRELEDALEFLKRYPNPPGQTGHCELHLAPVLAGGIAAVRDEVGKRTCSGRRMLRASNGEAETYQSFLYALDGLSAMIGNAAEAAKRQGLTDIAESCRRIVFGPPQTFRDAIQLLWLVILGVMHGEEVGLVVPGHLDRTLWPFYEADRANGALSRDEALLLIEGLYLLINDYVPDGLAMSVMVGGRDATGKDATNELSYLCIEALRRTRLIYPTVGICWHEGTPSALIDLAVNLIGNGNPNPAFFGDATIQRGLKSLGVPDAEAVYYINSTCVEITPAQSSNVWVASPYFSVCQVLRDEIAEQAAGVEAESFEGFRDRYFVRLGRHIAEAVRAENDARGMRRLHGGKPLQSVFTRDCIERGRDIDDGGARYNWVECSFVGLANLADSLGVIRDEVFKEKRLALAELKAALDADFDGREPLRQRFLHAHPKYGQDSGEMDALFAEMIRFVGNECAKHKMAPDGSPFVPGAFCWVMHEVLGRECGATPDGRKRGVPFADGCGPAQGRESRGPTAAILSTTSWDHSPMIGGLAYNMKFNRALFDGPDGFVRLRDLVLTFLRRGGFETQINVVNGDTLREARRNPEAYRDLIVRIGGYSDYFTRLSPEMQDEIILRTEFNRF